MSKMQIKGDVVQVTSELDAAWLAAHTETPQKPNQKLLDALARYEVELEKPTHE